MHEGHSEDLLLASSGGQARPLESMRNDPSVGLLHQRLQALSGFPSHSAATWTEDDHLYSTALTLNTSAALGQLCLKTELSGAPLSESGKGKVYVRNVCLTAVKQS